VNAVFSGLKPVSNFWSKQIAISRMIQLAFCNLVNPDYVCRSAYFRLQRSRFGHPQRKVLMEHSNVVFHLQKSA